ncbi:hypothetical protein [Nonomuraea basaltis]|uniref:hypothetical protein n=1 Tax=Nonomuraea basaltis TaxID=2495887 RepID=UPI00110C4B13|nr:hypothetical protein [Nonomuraea basaltis]TMR94389.1 hypothetical protein EJK15_34000 [Nonomuraea basaltis]
MRRALRYAAIWCGATVIAVSVSWFGVRGVLRSEFVDDVAVEPFLAQTAAADVAAPEAKTPTREPRTPEPRRTTKRPVPTPSSRGGSLKVVTVKGGEVAFRIGSDGCRLVSATPVSGYTAKVARAEGWIRVDLVKGEHGTGVFCIGHEQRTDTWEY